MNELDLIGRKDLRDEYIDRIGVLERVKQLLLLPDINLLTRRQVANYYEVDESAIRKIEDRNRDEINSDGFSIWKAENFKTDTMYELKITTNKGSFDVEFTNGDKERFSPRGVALYTRRAVLRIGMLLRDSEIAREVRSQLLNIEERSTTHQKIDSINEEQELILKIIYAKDDIERAVATGELLNYKNRCITNLENKVDALVDGNLLWGQREAVNRMVRLIAHNRFDGKFHKAWDKVFAEMLYRHNIGITRRKTESELKNPTIFDVIRDDEMKLLVQSCISLCEMYKINTDDLMIRNAC